MFHAFTPKKQCKWWGSQANGKLGREWFEGRDVFLLVFFPFRVQSQPLPPLGQSRKSAGLRPLPLPTPPLPQLAPLRVVQESEKLKGKNGCFSVDFHTLHISKRNSQKQLRRLNAFINSNSDSNRKQTKFFQAFLFILQPLVREQYHKADGGKKSFWTNLAPSCMASCE